MIKIATLVGCAIGDALGNPFEMKSAESPAIQEWDGLFKAGGTFWVGEPGQYTDDTLMSIALSTSLIEKQGFDPDDVAQKYLAWYDSGNTRGIGGTTASALMHYKMGATWQESGLTHNPDGTPTGGNGTAMRAAPWASGIVMTILCSSRTPCWMLPSLITPWSPRWVPWPWPWAMPCWPVVNAIRKRLWMRWLMFWPTPMSKISWSWPKLC